MKKVPTRMAVPDPSLAIVEREFELRSDGGETKVFARFRKPVPDGETDFQCKFEIEGLGDPISSRAGGVDVIQAYEMALQLAALRLLTSPAYQSGRLTFRGSYDLRLPLHESQSHLVRTDLERDRTVREFAGKDEPSKRFREEAIARLQDKSRVWPQHQDVPIVLERVLDLRRGRRRSDVRISFRKPVPDRLGHWCAFKIEGLLKKPQSRTRMLGVDAIDSLGNAMRLAMVYMVSSSEYQRGQLTWIGMYDLGMPIFDDAEPLIRKDLQAKFMAQMMMNPLTKPPGLRGKARKTRR
jgi:hypothetical protein